MSKGDDDIARLQQEIDRIWMAIEAIPAVRDAVRFAHVRQATEVFELQNDWAQRYGECIPIHVAAKIIGKTPESIRRWVREGKIMKSETGGIMTRSLAAHVEEGLPHNSRKKAKTIAKRAGVG